MRSTASSGVPAPSIPTESTILYQDPHVHGVKLFLHYGDLADSVHLVKLIYQLKPDEIYHLGAQSHVPRELRYSRDTQLMSQAWELFASWKQ